MTQQPFYMVNSSGTQNQLGGLRASPGGQIQSFPQAVDTRGGGMGEQTAGAPSANTAISPGAPPPSNSAPPGYMNPAGPPGMQGGGIPFDTRAALNSVGINTYDNKQAFGNDGGMYGGQNGGPSFWADHQRQPGETGTGGTTLAQEQLMAGLSDPYMNNQAKQNLFNTYKSGMGNVNTGSPVPGGQPGNSANANGQAGSNGNNGGLNNLPYDPAYTDQIRALDAQKSAFHAGLDQQGANDRLSAGSQKRDLETQKPIDLQSLLDNFANRGMSHSGKYATDYGGMQNDYSGKESGIDQSLAQQLSDLASQTANYDAQNLGDRSTAEQNYIRTLASNAGNLGLSNLPTGYDGSQGSQDNSANPIPTANFGLGDTQDGVGASPVPGLAGSPVNVGTPGYNKLPPVYKYSPGQLQLAKHLGINYHSMTPTQLHQLGVKTGFKPVSTATRSAKLPAAKNLPRRAFGGVKATPLNSRAPRRAR